MSKEELWNKTKEAEAEYKKLFKHCNDCHGNFNDDCRDCGFLDKRENAHKKFESYKKELKDKYNLDYDGFKKLSKALKGDTIYDDLVESQKNNLKLYTQADLDKKDKEIENLKNKYLYLQADLENIKKQYNKRISDINKYEGENIFEDLIEIFDDLEFSKDDDIDILNCYNKITKLLNKYGVYLIYKDNERPIFYNPETDEAITSVSCNDKNLDNSIYKVYKKGFYYKDKILRFEKVIVNKYE